MSRSRERSKKQHAAAGSPPPPAAQPVAEQPLLQDDAGAVAWSFPVVGIGASAGGLEAFTQLLRALPVDTGMAFVLIPHLSPSHASHMVEILARATTMSVSEVKDEPPVEPNRVYVIPPDCSMVMGDGTLKLLPRKEVRGTHHPIDQFLQSLARSLQHKSVGVILSGTANDGTVGLEEIKAAGGITLAQDESAQCDGMPRSAIMAGCVDFVLAPDAIARELARIARHRFVAPTGDPGSATYLDQQQIDQVLHLVHQRMGVDFSEYKPKTLRRRIARRMTLHKIDEIKEYLLLLRANHAEIELLYQDILISVTSFFRDPEAFDVLTSRVLPRLMQDRPATEPLRVWVVGCSTGEEAYSIAIAITEYMEQHRRLYPIQVFASDLNSASVDKARAGVYTKAIAEHVSPERLRRFFQEVDGGYRVAKSLRDMCVFARHNALSDPPFSRIDLITCRNLLIYLEPAMQQRLLPILHYALKPEGSMWLGSSETTGELRELFDVEDAKHRFFVRKLGRGGGLAPPRIEPRVELPVTPAPRELSAQARQSLDAQKEAERVLLARYTPPGVLVDRDFNVLTFRGDTSVYLAAAAGKASLNLLTMLREGLLVSVRGALTRAKKDRVTVRKEGLRVKTAGGHRSVHVEVVTVRGRVAGEDLFLVTFEAPRARVRSTVDDGIVTERETASRTLRLQQELSATKEYLQSVIEQQEAANEELQSANEEVQSTNEELQSINEEIETSKEEIQSSNEELATVNEEIQTRNAELAHSTNDLTNLLSSVQLAIVMLGPDLRIRRFTPQAERLLNLVPADIGRPLRDVKLTVDLPELEQLVLEVIETVAPQQREARDRDGRWHSIRIRPYRTADNRIDGAVLVSVDVDSLKRTEESLRSSEERLRITWEQAPIGIFETDLEGRFLRVNDPFCAIVGRPREQLLRVHSTDITHQDDVPADLEGFQRLSRGEVDALHLEKRYVHGAGHPVWVEIHRFNVKDDAGRARFTVGFVQDIGERKAAEAAVRQREARFRGVMDGAPVLIWMNGVEGTEYVNRAFLEFLGVGLADVLGTSWQRFVHDDDREAYAAAYRAALARLQPFEHQFRFRRADGEYRWMMAVALPQFGAASQFVGYTGSTFDITDFKRAEGALRDDDQRKNEFIATLAHELRNPLAPIANVAHLLRTPGIAERTIAWAHDVLQRQLGSLTRMVDDLLDVSRITQDKIRLHREPVDLADVITRSVDAAREGFARRALRIMVEVPTKPLILFADPVRLEQVLGNLLNNATKFTPQGGHIWLTATETSPGKDVTIRLRDDGDGIDGEVLPHVFEMFRQGDMSIARAHGGLGIGLTLVRRLIELHGGTVEAKSDGPGKGSELIVRLPLAETGTGAAARPAVPPSTDGGTRRILIIDDNADAATSLAFLLRHDGHVVEVAHSGPTGLDTTRAFKPQVVLLDLGMPGMNGFEVARRLRQDAHGDDLIIVATSGYSGEDMRRRAQEAGFDEYIVKPIDRAILHTLLGRGRASPV